MTSPSGPPTVGETTGDDAAATQAAEGAQGANGSGNKENADEVQSFASAGDAAQSPVSPAGDPAQPYDRGPVWAMLLPPLVGLALGLWGVTTPSYWRDEAATIAAVSRPFPALIHMLGNVDAVHSVYYMMMWPLVHLFGSGALVMRLPSVIAAALTAAAIAAIGRRVLSPWVGLAAGLLFAVLPVATRYGQEARPYAFVVGLAVLASYLLGRVLMADPARRRKWLIGYAAGLAALGIVNIFGLLLIPAHAITVAFAIRRRGWDDESRRLAIGWLVASVVGVVCASPLLVLGYQQRGQVAWIANNKSSSGLITLVTLAGSSLITVAIIGIVAIALILHSEAAGGAARRAIWRWELAELSLPWMLVPPALLLGASVITPIYTSRYVLMCVPALALLGGMAIVALGRIFGPVALVLILLAGLTVQVTQRQPYGHYDDVRALDQVVAANAKPGDVVLYTNPNAESFGAAYPTGLGKLRNIQTKEAAIPSGTLAGTSVDIATLKARLRQASRVWVVEINRCVSEPELLSLSGSNEGPALTGVPLQFVKVWHERGDWLLLYQHGTGSQAPATACNGAP